MLQKRTEAKVITSHLAVMHSLGVENNKALNNARQKLIAMKYLNVTGCSIITRANTHTLEADNQRIEKRYRSAFQHYYFDWIFLPMLDYYQAKVSIDVKPSRIKFKGICSFR